jgi:hypothetical protein
MQVKARSKVKLLVAGLLLAAAGQPAAAQKNDKAERQLPEVFTKVVECRAIADDAERLACFDTAVSALATAQETKEVRVVSREDVNRTRRSLFGFVTSGFGLFGSEGEEEEQEELKEINATIASFSGATGSYVFTLDDGSVWEQSDGVYLKKPKEGQPIRIRRSFLSSYMANIDGGIGFRIKRRR